MHASHRLAERPGRRLCPNVHLLLPVLAAALAQAASATEDSGYRSYRCAVLGDSGACRATPSYAASTVEERIVAGPYARYLMSRRGLDHDAATAEAAALGEAPVKHIVLVTTRTLTDLERYDRWAGRPVAAERTEVTLSAIPLSPALDPTRGRADAR